MFRNLISVALIALGLAFYLGGPDKWQWPDKIAPQVGDTFRFLITTQPLTTIVMIFLAVALLMSKKAL